MTKNYYERRAKEIVQEARTRKGEADSPPEPPKVSKSKEKALAQVIQLQLWPETQRVAPNVMLRSALFAVVKKGERKQFKKQLLASWPATEIRFTGEQLDQFDETVWFETVHLAAEHSRNKTVAQFKLGGFLRRLGLNKDGRSMKRLDAAFTRMIACEVRIQGDGFHYRDNMLGIHVDESSGVYTVRLNPALVQLFDAGITRVEWETRLALRTDLAKWLHGFVLSHRADERHPQRVAVATLSELSGVTTELKDFRRKLKDSMRQLHELGLVSSWRITENDALEYTRARRKTLNER